MTKNYALPCVVAFLLANLLFADAALSNSFRGIPYFVKIDRVAIKNSSSPSGDKFVDVCYRFSTTTPLFDYSDTASNLLNGVPLTPMRAPTYPDHGNAQDVGIPFRFRAFGFEIVAYLKSELLTFNLPSLTYFNGVVRNTVGVAKPFLPHSYSINYRSMTYPQYEWVTSCETIPFPKALSDTYILNLFNGSGPIGHFAGDAQFSLNLFPPPFLGTQPLTFRFNQTNYVVPIFGAKPLSVGDLRMISLSHFINSVNALRANLDQQAFNKFLSDNRNIVRSFEEHYHIQVPLPLDAGGIVELLHRVLNIEDPSTN